MEDGNQKYTEQIKIVKNFITSEEADFYLQYINNNDHLMKRSRLCGEASKVLKFGKQTYEKYTTNKNLSIISDIEPIVRNKIFSKVEQTIKAIYANEKDLFLSDIYFAKQSSGGWVQEHSDQEGDAALHVKYSGIIYLNDVEKGGALVFPKLNYEYSPKAGDIVTFPSAGDKYVHFVTTVYEDRYTLPVWVTEDEFWKL